GRLTALGFDDAMQGLVDILGHALGIATDVEMSPLFEPLPEFGSGLQHASLHVNLFLLVATEGRVEAGEVTALHPGDDLLLVEEVGRALLITKEQPVFAVCPGRLALFEKGTK